MYSSFINCFYQILNRFILSTRCNSTKSVNKNTDTIKYVQYYKNLSVVDKRLKLILITLYIKI